MWCEKYIISFLRAVTGSFGQMKKITIQRTSKPMPQGLLRGNRVTRGVMINLGGIGGLIAVSEDPCPHSERFTPSRPNVVKDSTRRPY